MKLQPWTYCTTNAMKQPFLHRPLTGQNLERTEFGSKRLVSRYSTVLVVGAILCRYHYGNGYCLLQTWWKPIWMINLIWNIFVRLSLYYMEKMTSGIMACIHITIYLLYAWNILHFHVNKVQAVVTKMKLFLIELLDLLKVKCNA